MNCKCLQGLRFKKAHVTHPELKATFCLPILGVKKNPSSSLYTTLGVITKGTVIEVNVSELGLVTQGGKVIWGQSDWLFTFWLCNTYKCFTEWKMKCDVVFQVNSPRWRITQKMMAVLMPCCLYNGNLKRLTWNCDSWVQPGTALAWILLSLSEYRRSWNHKTGWFADSWSFVFSSGLTKTRGSEIKCCLFSNKIFSCFSLHLLFFHCFCILS